MEVVNETILIVEDNVGLNELLSEKVNDCGYETYSVYSAVQAFEWLEGNSAFLILLDFSLPDMNGKEFIELLIAEKFPLPPFIVATGQGDERIAVQMMKLGARDYVVKDSNFLELMPLVISKVSSEIKKEQKIQLIENELAESNKFNKQIIKGAQEGIVVYDLDLKYQVWNPFMEKITGVQAINVLGKKVLDVFPFLAKMEISENLKRALKGEQSSEIEFYFAIPETGKSGWVSETVAPLRNVENQIIGAIAAVHDITERKNAEKSLVESEEKYRILVENAGIGVALYSTDGKILFFNDKAVQNMGGRAEDYIGKYLYEFFDEVSATEYMNRIQLTINSEKSIEFEDNVTLKSGNYWFLSNHSKVLNKDGELIGVQVLAHDITERKLAEMRLLESESRYHTLFNSSFEAILLTSPDGTIIAANPSACEMFMMKEDEIIQKGRNGIIDVTDSRLPMALEVREKTGKFNGELDFVRANGEKFTGDISSSIFVDKDGNNRTSTIIRDVTERKKVENELRESEARFRHLLQDVQTVSVQGYAPDGTTQYWNKASEQLYGYTAQEAIGKKLVDLIIPFEMREEVEKAIQLMAKTGQPIPASEMSLMRKGGSRVSVLSNHSIVKIAGQPQELFCIDIDLTERKKAEDALRENETKYRELVENSPDAIVIYSDGVIRFVNKTGIQLIGAKSEKELLGKPVIEFVHPDSRKMVMERVKTIQTPGKVLDSQEEKFIRLDGSSIEVEVKAMSLMMDNKLAVQLIVRDITERKNAEFVMQENRNMLHQLLFTSSELIDSTSNTVDYERITEIARELSGAKYACFNLFDENGRDFETVAFSGLTDFQQKALDLFGFEVINKKWAYDPIREERLKDNTITEFDSLETLAHNLLPKFVFNKIKKIYKFGKIDVVKITKNNKNIGDFTLLMKEGVDIKNPEILELFANQVGLFIERQISEEKLRKNEEKFRILFAENPQPMFVYDVETLEILEVNQTALNFYGYSKKDFLSMSVQKLHPLEELPIFLKTIEQTRAGINTDGISQHIKKNGEKVTVEIFTVPATLIGANARHVLVVDITERKLSEEALTQKMDELMRFQHLTVGREHTMIELKKEINRLLVRNGEIEKYKIVE